jgi:hypothetical protein
VAILIAITAIVPSIFVPVAVVIAVIVAFAWANEAAHNKGDQRQQKAALRNTYGIFHGRSNAVDSTALIQSRSRPRIMAARNRFVGAVASIYDQLDSHCEACGIVQTIDDSDG